MNDLSTLPDGLPWSEHHAFLLLDGATDAKLPAQLKRLDPTASVLPLYDQPPLAALRDVSPLLVSLEHAGCALAQFYLQHASQECGLLLFSAMPAYAVAEHLRQLLIVELPSAQSALLRLADAAVARALLASADPSLFGPLNCVVTADRVNAVWHIQRPRQPDCPPLRLPYRLSAEQDAALNQVDRRRTLLDLDAHLRKHFPGFHGEQCLSLRWPMLERIETEAHALGLNCPSELFNYANLMPLLDGSDISQHRHIHHLLYAPSLQSPGERVALAVALAERWAEQKEPS